MFNLIKKTILLIISIPSAFGYCLLLKNQQCPVRKVITDNDYIIFLIKLGLMDVLEVVMIKIILILNFVYQILSKKLV